MIRLYTGRAVDGLLKRHAVALATQYAAEIEKLLPLPCKHRNGGDIPSCPACSVRRAVRAAAGVVRETGGVK